MGITRIEDLASQLNYNQPIFADLLKIPLEKLFTQLRLSVRLKYAKKIIG